MSNNSALSAHPALALARQAIDQQSVDLLQQAVDAGLTQRMLFLKEDTNHISFNPLVAMPLTALDALLPILRPVHTGSRGWKDLIEEIMGAGRCDWLKRLIEAKKIPADFCWGNEKQWGIPLLTLALKKGKSGLALMLIEKGANVNASDRFDDSALTALAAIPGSEVVEVFEAIASRIRPPLQPKDPRLGEALRHAAIRENLPLLRALVERGADPLGGSRSERAFVAAARCGKLQSLAFFLEKEMPDALLKEAAYCAGRFSQGGKSVEFLVQWQASHQQAKLEQAVPALSRPRLRL